METDGRLKGWNRSVGLAVSIALVIVVSAPPADIGAINADFPAEGMLGDPSAGMPPTNQIRTGVYDTNDGIIDWRPIDDFREMDEPDVWLEDPRSGLHYRRTTIAEQEQYGWIAGSYIVEQGDLVNRLERPVNLEILLPYNDTVTETLSLHLVEASVGPPSAEFNSNGTVTITEPTYFKYIAQSSDGIGAFLVTSTQGWGMAGRAAFDDRIATIASLSDRVNLTALLTASGEPLVDKDLFIVQFIRMVDGGDLQATPCSTIFHRMSWTRTYASCGLGDDGGDGAPPVGGSDGPSVAAVVHKYAMLGEGMWCEERQEQGENWNEELSLLGWTVRDGFSNTQADMQYEWNFCHTEFNDVGHAEVCDAGDNWWPPECEYSDGHTYAFHDCDAVADCYRSNAWSDVVHFREHGSNAPLLDVVNVIHRDVMNSGTKCGRAYFPGSGPDNNGAGVSTDWTRTGCAPYVATHEIGHNFGAIHDDADDCTVMQSGAQCRSNSFSDPNRDTVDNCATDTDCPRTNRK